MILGQFEMAMNQVSPAQPRYAELEEIQRAAAAAGEKALTPAKPTPKRAPKSVPNRAPAPAPRAAAPAGVPEIDVRCAGVSPPKLHGPGAASNGSKLTESASVSVTLVPR